MRNVLVLFGALSSQPRIPYSQVLLRTWKYRSRREPLADVVQCCRTEGSIYDLITGRQYRTGRETRRDTRLPGLREDCSGVLRCRLQRCCGASRHREPTFPARISAGDSISPYRRWAPPFVLSSTNLLEQRAAFIDYSYSDIRSKH